MRQLKENAGKNRKEKPWSFTVGVVAVVIGTAGLAVCIASYLAAISGW
jgi:hypothetical protein